MRKILVAAALLFPTSLLGAELWCMPDAVCRSNGKCSANSDEESSLRIHHMRAAMSTMRSHVETIKMARSKAGTSVEWTGTNEFGGQEFIIWDKSTNAFTYTITNADGTQWKSTGVCEVQ